MIRYVKNRRTYPHAFTDVYRDFCAHCGWSARFVVNARAVQCPTVCQRAAHKASRAKNGVGDN